MSTRGNDTSVLNVINATTGNVISAGMISDNIFIHKSDIQEIKYDNSDADSLSDYVSAMNINGCALFMKITIETIKALMTKMRIRRQTFGGMSGNEINGSPLVLMMILQDHLRQTILKWNSITTDMGRGLFKISTAHSNKYGKTRRRRNYNLSLGHKLESIKVG